MTGEKTVKLTPIQQFYYNKSLFITGGTGFFGKVTIEKLLRTCDVECLFLLVRDKKGTSSSTRVNEIFNDPLFDILRKESPDFKSKVTGISGECGIPGLGISLEDRAILIEKVQIVIHGAATVRFDEQLNTALKINVFGTKDMLTLALGLTHLEAFIHISTAFSNCTEYHIEEKVYDQPLSATNAMKLSECLDEKTLLAIEPKILGDCPNTYIFTKRLAEDMVLQYGKQGVPVLLFRPSIVIPKYLEPAAGWINNYYGPYGVAAAVALGILRVIRCTGSGRAPLVPVDMCVNTILAGGWDVAKNQYESPRVYNYAGSATNFITWKGFMEITIRNGENFNFTKAVWCVSLTLSSSKIIVKMLQFFLHIVPAMFVDFACIILGRKFRMIKVYKKVHKFCDVLGYFATKQWTFESDNVKSLWAKLDPQDQQLFFFDMDSVDWDKCLDIGTVGIRKYLIKDENSNIATNKRMLRIRIIHKLLVNSFRAFGCYLLYLLIVTIWNIFA